MHVCFVTFKLVFSLTWKATSLPSCLTVTSTGLASSASLLFTFTCRLSCYFVSAAPPHLEDCLAGVCGGRGGDAGRYVEAEEELCVAGEEEGVGLPHLPHLSPHHRLGRHVQPRPALHTTRAGLGVSGVTVISPPAPPLPGHNSRSAARPGLPSLCVGSDSRLTRLLHICVAGPQHAMPGRPPRLSTDCPAPPVYRLSRPASLQTVPSRAVQTASAVLTPTTPNTSIVCPAKFRNCFQVVVGRS